MSNIIDSRQQTADSRQQTADSRQQTADSRQQTADSRRYYFDFLRVAGAFAVIVLHVASQNWSKTDVHTLEWQAMNFWRIIAVWPVPVFVMISGALFLNPDKQIPTKKLYTKYIFRIFTAFVFWALVYACTYYALKKDALRTARYLFAGEYHMWFLFMIVGLYMIVPFVRRIAESEMLTKYFLVMVFVFAFALPEIVDIISVFTEKGGKFAGGLVDRFSLKFVGGFTGYFLLGYFLDRVEIPRKIIRLIYVAGIVGGLFCVIASSLVSVAQDAPNQIFYNNHTVNVLCEAVAVFVFFRQRLNFPARFIRVLSQYTFGAYLVHVAVIRALAISGLDPLTFSPVISIPVISVIVFVISFTISAILNHIPVLNKYIV